MIDFETGKIEIDENYNFELNYSQKMELAKAIKKVLDRTNDSELQDCYSGLLFRIIILK